MVNRSTLGVVLAVVVAGALATGCTTTQGIPVAAQSPTSRPELTTSVTAPSTPTTTSTTVAATPTGPPIANATMEVRGSGAGPVTIRYTINGAPEQVETNVTLPWQKVYPVYNEIQSSVTADGGDTELICTITMDGDKLVSFKTEARPTCSFAYYE